MATVYSLVCWGGLTGKSVTASNSSGLIFTTASAHGLRDGHALQFTATTLPGNVLAATTYYVGVLTTTAFSIYTEPALTNRVAWSSAGTAVIAKSKKGIDYLASPPTPLRWGSSPERCYDSFSSWNTARATALATDVEVLEIGESFTLVDIAGLTINIPAGAVQITTRINNQRTGGWHGGQVPNATPTLSQGFILQNPGTTGAGLILSTPNSSVEGFIVKMTGGSSMYMLRLLAFGCSADSMIAIGNGYSTHDGIRVDAAGCKLKNSLAVGWSIGIRISPSQMGIVVANNIVTKCTRGFYGDYAEVAAYNNIAIGNTTDWWPLTPGSTARASHNAGLSEQAWITGTNPRVTIATSDLANWGATTIADSDDFSAASSSSPQVDAAVIFYDVLPYDLAGDERPNYNNGGSEAYDIGCYEFDHGYGPRPITASLTLTGLSSGTDVVVRTASTSTILDSVDSTSGAWVYTYATPHAVDIDIIKPGMVIVTFRNLSLTSVSSSLPIAQQTDRNYS